MGHAPNQYMVLQLLEASAILPWLHLDSYGVDLPITAQKKHNGST